MNKKTMMAIGATFTAAGAMFLSPMTASAHCDTVDGPVVGDAQKAIEENNFNHIAKWVLPDDEAEVMGIFEQAMEVRDDSPEAEKLADQYLFENLVRIHRQGEGAPYTGVKPEGTPIEAEIAAADKSIEVGNLDPLEGVVEPDLMPHLEEAFTKLMATKEFDIDDVEAGREYVMNYVIFTHLAEGEEHAEEPLDHKAEVDEGHEIETVKVAGESTITEVEQANTNWLSWGLAALFFVTTIIGFSRKKHNI